MAQTMKNKASWLPLVTLWFLVSGGMFAQTDVVIRWVDEQGEPASQNELAGIVLHVSSWLDGVTRDAVQSEVLVVDSAGWCQWPQVADGVYNLEALPWSWTVVVEGWNESAGIDSLTLIWPNEPIAGLRGILQMSFILPIIPARNSRGWIGGRSTRSIRLIWTS